MSEFKSHRHQGKWHKLCASEGHLPGHLGLVKRETAAAPWPHFPCSLLSVNKWREGSVRSGQCHGSCCFLLTQKALSAVFKGSSFWQESGRAGPDLGLLTRIIADILLEGRGWGRKMSLQIFTFQRWFKTVSLQACLLSQGMTPRTISLNSGFSQVHCTSYSAGVCLRRGHCADLRRARWVILKAHFFRWKYYYFWSILLNTCLSDLLKH